jgi:GNAT superfamily N-acetyltransferase
MNQEADGYVIASCAVGDLSTGEKARCLRLIAEGAAVNADSAARDFPRSAMIAVARKGGAVVGVASIKPIREDYAAGRAKKAGFTFDRHTPEFGYVAVDPSHRGNRLSSLMAEALVKDGSALFATTSDPRMKSALKGAGFVQRGIEWRGIRGDLISLWIRS